MSLRLQSTSVLSFVVPSANMTDTQTTALHIIDTTLIKKTLTIPNNAIYTLYFTDYIYSYDLKLVNVTEKTTGHLI